MNIINLNKAIKKKTVNVSELKKAEQHVLAELIDYQKNSIQSRSIVNKASGSVNLFSFDAGRGLDEKTSPFDTFAQIIDGCANLIIDGRSYFLSTGQGIIIPAHASNCIMPNGRFKMMVTVIKSGYE